MRSKIGLAVSAAVIALSAAALAPQAHAQSGVKVGVLSCNVDSGWGFVFGSSRGLKCSFTPSSNAAEHYAGHISKFGVDIGYVQSAVIVWAVFAPGTNIAAGALAGDYAGVTGGASVGVGAGANVLVGGSNKAITLQPVSIEGNTGLNVAAGIAAVTLEFQKN
ncbi:MAG TPA: DUF992 domain-containing protein [Stellaceae bacterium]|nr:DUF992 domain-containing protein [Stellaceae bacterium]